MSSVNPYLNRVMIQDPTQFFGRRREVSRIFSRIGAPRPQSVSLVGERRIGKSSLLWHLSHEQIQREHVEDAASLLVVFLDFQQLHHIKLEDFFELLLAQIRRCAADLPSGEGSGYPAFQGLLEILGRRGKRLVLLLDEFDAITSNPTFSSEFFAFFRSMANNYAVAYLTSSKTELQRLCHSSQIAASPFFNIFTNLYLRPFDDREALDLICRPSKGEGSPLKPYSREIIDLAGTFPFYLQIACCAYFDWLDENPGQAPESAEMERRFLEEAGPHFEYVWKHSGEDRRRVLRRFIRGEQPLPEEVHVCERLRRDGYLLGEAAPYRLFSGAFGRYVGTLEAAGDLGRRPPALTETGLPFTLGTQINQYLILTQAGEGGMGIVYEAEDRSLHRRVALKVIRPEFLEMENTRKRFLQEAQSAAALNHPAIASIYEFFTWEEQFVMVMEWLEGHTLKQRIAGEGRIPWRELLSWTVEACRGLEAAHQRGIVHRDVKSSNLMICRDGRVKILDFGLAKQSLPRDGRSLGSQITLDGSLLGTIDYMSPEQARGEPVDARSDLFSLGVVLYEGLSGRLPFHRPSTAATLQAIVGEPAPPLHLYGAEERERLDRLERVMKRLLEKAPGRRYAGASQLESDLRELLNEGQGRKSLLDWLRG